MKKFMIYRLTWNQAKDKYDKKPVGLDGSALLNDGGIPTADRASVTATVARLGSDYRLGVWVEAPYFFLDLDENAVINGTLSAQAAAMAGVLIAAGCYFEASTSGRGAHVIGRYSGELPAHQIQPKSLHPHGFYTHSRGCVLSDAHAGDWEVDATPAVVALLTKYFPPRNDPAALHALTAGPRPDWRGPADDNLLITRMLAATGSAVSRLQGKTTLQQLWAGECEQNNENDLALASHLAFWTGCDVDRIERLMRRSGLARDKWDDHATYLRELTITQACVTTDKVYIEPKRVDTAAALLGVSRPPVRLLPPPSMTANIVSDAPDWHSAVDTVVALINSTGTRKELYDNVMPTLAAYGWPKIYGETVATTLNRKLELFGAKQPISVLRELVMPRATDVTQQQAPEWAESLVFVRRTDKFFDTATGAEFSKDGLRMSYNRLMPIKSTGQREDVVQWLCDRWSVRNVDDVEYRPDQPPIFDYAGRTFANLFRVSTMPETVIGSDECAACVELFRAHLWQVVNQREPLFHALIGWLAHNVQFPGVKILWSPLIKGVQGDGKSIFGELLRNAMGSANVKVTSASSISNKGGFTDWASGKAVNVIEEIKLEGKESRAMYNNMKTLIGDKQIDLNRKGRPSGDNLENITNHWANTQHVDAVPVEKGERRWLIVFTPWGSAHEAARLKGLPDADSLPSYFERLGASMRKEPGAWRAWLMGIDLSSFKPNSRALWTAERDAMSSGSGDFVEQTVEDCIVRGGPGICADVFCSPSLMGRAQVDLGEKPDGRSWNKILTHLGYQQHPTTVWWNGRVRRVWTKISMTKDEIRERLDKTLNGT